MWRAQMLEQAIANMLTGKDLLQDELAKKTVENFYNQPLLKGLHSGGGNRKPSQIPSKQFASAIFDSLIKAGTEDSDVNRAKPAFERLQESIQTIKKQAAASSEGAVSSGMHNLAQAMETLLIDVSHKTEEADKSIAEARKRIENWYNDAMDRVGGAYKRKAQAAALVAGLVLAAVLNADALAIANTLWREPLIREALVAQAENFQLPADQKASSQQIIDNYNTLQGLSVPLGWSTDNIREVNSANAVVLKIVGIALSGIAAAQGAPFWFDVMRKLLSLRSGGASEPAAKEPAK